MNKTITVIVKINKIIESNAQTLMNSYFLELEGLPLGVRK